MEMEFKDNSRRRTLVLVVGVLLALGAGAAAFMLSSQGTDEPTETIPLRDESPGRQDLDALVRSLDDGGLVCLPCSGNYRILADLTNPGAVTRLGSPSDT